MKEHENFSGIDNASIAQLDRATSYPSCAAGKSIDNAFKGRDE